jgi:hypothetical protein
MKRALLFVLLATVTVPLFAESSEFGVVFGGSRRFIREDDRAPDVDYDLSGFEFSNSSLELYYGFELEPGTMFKLKAGRIEGPVAYEAPEAADVEGELQHVDGVIEFNFSEAFGSTGIFGGLGLYRQEAPDFPSETSWGFSFGVNGDFPLSRRYGVIVEGAYHWTQFDVKQRFLTVGAGLRIAF